MSSWRDAAPLAHHCGGTAPALAKGIPTSLQRRPGARNEGAPFEPAAARVADEELVLISTGG